MLINGRNIMGLVFFDPDNTIKRRVKEAISITETKETLREKIWGPGPTTSSMQTYAQKEQKRNFA